MQFPQEWNKILGKYVGPSNQPLERHGSHLTQL
jgi:hypothetical protein